MSNVLGRWELKAFMNWRKTKGIRVSSKRRNVKLISVMRYRPGIDTMKYLGVMISSDGHGQGLVLQHE